MQNSGMGIGKGKKTWSEDIRWLFAEENAIFFHPENATNPFPPPPPWIQVKAWGRPSLKITANIFSLTQMLHIYWKFFIFVWYFTKFKLRKNPPFLPYIVNF